MTDPHAPLSYALFPKGASVFYPRFSTFHLLRGHIMSIIDYLFGAVSPMGFLALIVTHCSLALLGVATGYSWGRNVMHKERTAKLEETLVDSGIIVAVFDDPHKPGRKVYQEFGTGFQMDGTLLLREHCYVTTRLMAKRRHLTRHDTGHSVLEN